MEIYPILNKPGKGKYVFIFILNERAVRDIEVAPADTDAIRHAPEVGGHVGKVGEAEPSPHKFAK